MLTEYTTYDDIRAALGVSTEEIDDATLGLESFLTLLEEDLLAVNSAVPTAWAALPSDPDTDTAEQKRFRRLVKLYSTYAVAYRLLDSAEMFGFLKVADGRASAERAAKAFENLRVNVSVMLGKVKVLLLDALLGVSPSAVIPASVVSSYVSGVPGGTDPVTNT